MSGFLARTISKKIKSDGEVPLSPKIVFLLGEKVYSSVGKHFKIKFDKWNGFEYHYKIYDGIY